MAYQVVVDGQGRPARIMVLNESEDGTGTWHIPITDSSGNTMVKAASNTGVDIGDVDILSIAAGDTRIGTVSGVMKEVRVTKAIIGGANTAGDVLSEATTDTTGTAWTFSAVARANGGYGYIVGAKVVSESENVTPRLTLLLFNALPTGEKDDNAPNTSPVSADRAKFIGAIEFPALHSILTTSDSWSVATPSTVGNLPLPFKCAAAADDLFGILVSVDAFTQEAGDDIEVTLIVEQY